MTKDPNVPWPDGSWLTWNEETKTWVKHEGPRPEESPRKKTAATKAKPTGAKAKTTGAKAKTTGAKAKTTGTKPAATTKKKTTTTKATETPTPVAAKPAAPIRTDVSVTSPARSRQVRKPGEGSLLPTIAWGCVVGVLAGYFLSFLIR